MHGLAPPVDMASGHHLRKHAQLRSLVFCIQRQVGCLPIAPYAIPAGNAMHYYVDMATESQSGRSIKTKASDVLMMQQYPRCQVEQARSARFCMMSQTA